MIPSQRDEPQWPPRSPRDALLLTPRGREKFRAMSAEKQRHLQMSPSSPSPLRRTRMAHSPDPADVLDQDHAQIDQYDDEDDDDDEETLQLKLQAIQARLKLKRLQKEREKRQLQQQQQQQQSSSPANSTTASTTTATSSTTPVGPSSRPRFEMMPPRDRVRDPSLLDAPMFANLPKSPATVGKSPARLAYARSPANQLPNPMMVKPSIPPPPSPGLTTGPSRAERDRAQSAVLERKREAEQKREREREREVEVPVSPVQRVHRAMDATSPLRQILSKGLRAEDISLGRHGRSQSAASVSTGGSSSGYLRTARSGQFKTAASTAVDRPLSFNERLALAKAEETEKKERQERIQQIRESTFGISQTEMDKFKAEAAQTPSEPATTAAAAGPRNYTREEILGTKPIADTSKSEASFESYSSFHLSKRILPHSVVARHMNDAKVFSVSDLVRSVKAPNFELPDIEQNIVAFAILAKKSEPRDHKKNLGGSDNKESSKYMVITLTDLTHDLELFLFGTGFKRFWKLTEGTVIAILNPGVMPPPQGRADTGRWSLVINSDADTVLEIGTARDLGYCKAVKRDGNVCEAWVNAKRTEYCEYHSNASLQRVKQGRIEMTGSGFGRGGSDWNGMGALNSKKYGSGSGFRSGGAARAGSSHELGRGKGHSDFDAQATFFLSRTVSAADMLDGKHMSMAEKQQREENLRRALLQKEKERQLARQLAGMSNASVGRDYMAKVAGLSDTATGDGKMMKRKKEVTPEPGSSSAAVIGDGIGRGCKAEDIDLYAGKRKRADSAMSSSNAGSGSGSVSGSGSGNRASYGWGKGLKEKLDRMKSGEKLRPVSAIEGIVGRGGGGGGLGGVGGEEGQVAGKDLSGGRDRSPVRKKTRFVTDHGIKEAGNESLAIISAEDEEAETEVDTEAETEPEDNTGDKRSMDRSSMERSSTGERSTDKTKEEDKDVTDGKTDDAAPEMDFILEIEGAPPGFKMD